MSFLATSSSVLDHYLRSINQGFSIGFTSVLIIVRVLCAFKYLSVNNYGFMFVEISIDCFYRLVPLLNSEDLTMPTM